METNITTYATKDKYLIGCHQHEENNVTVIYTVFQKTHDHICDDMLH